MKKILLISSNSSDKGGGERYLVYLSQGLQEIGYSVHVLLSDVNYMNVWADMLIEKGCIVHRLPLTPLKFRPFRFIQSLIDFKQHNLIAKFCKKINPDGILVNQQYDEDGLDYVIGAVKSKIAPVVGTIHMPMTASKNKRPLGRIRGLVLKKWYKNTNYGIIFVSKRSQQEFHSYYGQTNFSTAVSLGVPFSPQQANSHICTFPERLNKNVPTIGFIGQFSEQKNLSLLIDCWHSTIRDGYNSNLLLVGDGDEKERIEHQLLKFNSTNKWFITGWQKNPENFLGLIDVYLMTSHFEGLPLALLEASGKGIPAIITNFNGAADVAQKAQWIKVSPETDVESIKRILIDVLVNLTSLKTEAKANLKDFQEYFSVRRMALETVNFLQYLKQ